MPRSYVHLLIGLFLFVLFLLLPFPGLAPAAHKVLAVAVLMAYWWITEAVPIPVTSLLPLFLFPIMGVLDAKAVSAPYADRNVFLFIGGFFIARAMEKHGLHKRIALQITLRIGRSDRTLILGFMVATAFVSMWISNTATTMMMVPIALAVLARGMEERAGKALLIGIAYAASIGGMGTLIGTPPNLVFAGQVKELLGREVSFSQWLFVGIPMVLIFLPIAWVLLTRFVFWVSGERQETGREVLEEELRALGPMKFEEKVVFWTFVFVALLWLTRGDLNLGVVKVRGWASLLGISKYVHDSTVAILGALILFLFPQKQERGAFVLDWETAVTIPWGIVLLFGGGFALAHAFTASGLSQWIGERLHFFQHLPAPLIVLGVSLLVTFLTELTSNTATATMILPVMAALAQGIGVHPYLLMIPATLSASCAFMLPVATPPNAIVFGSGELHVYEMARAGIWMNLIGALIVLLVVYLFGMPFLFY